MTNREPFDELLYEIERASIEFKNKLLTLEKSGGVNLPVYVAYISMQYHLTKGVQKHFYTIAGNSELEHKKEFRNFLVNFANEEEPHYEIALKDIENLGLKPLPVPFDVELWWAYFDKVVMERPFLRLGATCILENISSKSTELVKKLLSQASFLNPRNTVFLTIHMHGVELPHGDQILNVIKSAQLSSVQLKDLVEGARKGATLYLRMVEWALTRREFDLIKRVD